jgi:hypothetical protein
VTWSTLDDAAEHAVSSTATPASAPTRIRLTPSKTYETPSGLPRSGEKRRKADQDPAG